MYASTLPRSNWLRRASIRLAWYRHMPASSCVLNGNYSCSHTMNMVIPADNLQHGTHLRSAVEYQTMQNTGQTYHLPVRMIRFVAPVDVHPVFLDTAGYKHRQHWEDHANHHADTKRRANATPIQQRIDNTVKYGQQCEDKDNIEQREPCCWHLHTKKQPENCPQPSLFQHRIFLPTHL